MNGNLRLFRGMMLVAASTAMAVGAAAGWADEPLPEIVVRADRVSHMVEEHPAGGATIEKFALSRQISYRDLDLTKAAGAAELEKRVKDTAAAVCKRLDELYPNTVAGGHGCEDSAAKTAMVKVRAAIAAAKPR